MHSKFMFVYIYISFVTCKAIILLFYVPASVPVGVIDRNNDRGICQPLTLSLCFSFSSSFSLAPSFFFFWPSLLQEKFTIFWKFCKFVTTEHFFAHYSVHIIHIVYCEIQLHPHMIRKNARRLCRAWSYAIFVNVVVWVFFFCIFVYIYTPRTHARSSPKSRLYVCKIHMRSCLPVCETREHMRKNNVGVRSHLCVHTYVHV